MMEAFLRALMRHDEETLSALVGKDTVYRDIEGTLHFGKEALKKLLALNLGDHKKRYVYENIHVCAFTRGILMKVKFKDGFLHRVYIKKNDPSSRRFRIDFAYDGTLFYGFQRQKRRRSVQGVLESVLKHICGHDVKLHPAGRTDKGVHALHQVAHFDTSSHLESGKIEDVMATMLPEDIVLIKIEEVPEVFHARYDVLKKTYRYTLIHRKDPFYAHKALYCPLVDADELLNLLKQCEGTHDFKGFCKQSPNQDTVKTIDNVVVRREKDFTHIELTGNGFLRHMVRIIVGNALNDIRKGTSLVKTALQNPDKNSRKHMAKASALTLANVVYKTD